MEDGIYQHRRPNQSRLEKWKADIERMRFLEWPYSRIAEWLGSENQFAISREAVRQYCVRRGIRKGGNGGKTGELSEAESSLARTEAPAIPKRNPKTGRKRKFEYDDSRPIDRWGAGPSEEGGRS